MYTPAIYRQICVLSSPNSSNPDIPTSNGLKLYFNWQWPLQHHDFQVILFLHAHIPPQFIDKQQHDFQVILFLHAHIPPQYIDKQHTVKSKFFQSRYPTSNGLKLYFTWQWPLQHHGLQIMLFLHAHIPLQFIDKFACCQVQILPIQIQHNICIFMLSWACLSECNIDYTDVCWLSWDRSTWSSPNSSDPDIPTSNGLKLYFNWQWPLQDHGLQIILFLHAHILIDKYAYCQVQILLIQIQHNICRLLWCLLTFLGKDQPGQVQILQSRYPTSNGLKLYLTQAWQWPLQHHGLQIILFLHAHIPLQFIDKYACCTLSLI